MEASMTSNCIVIFSCVHVLVSSISTTKGRKTYYLFFVRDVCLQILRIIYNLYIVIFSCVHVIGFVDLCHQRKEHTFCFLFVCLQHSYLHIDIFFLIHYYHVVVSLHSYELFSTSIKKKTFFLFFYFLHFLSFLFNDIHYSLCFIFTQQLLSLYLTYKTFASPRIHLNMIKYY